LYGKVKYQEHHLYSTCKNGEPMKGDPNFFKTHSYSVPMDYSSGYHKEERFTKRIHPIFDHYSIVAEGRASVLKKSGVRAEIKIEPTEDCDFCHYEERSPINHVIHHNCDAVSFLNQFPWEHMQFVTAYPPFNNGHHKLLLSEMDFKDLERMIESEFDVADMLYKMRKDHEEIVGVSDFTNWGPYAGASKQHPHSQRQALTYLMDPVQEKELRACYEFYFKHNKNPFDVLVEKELEADERVVFDNDEIYIGADFAPKKPKEIIVIPKSPFSHIIETTQDDRKFIRSALGVFPAMRYYEEIYDVNIVVHMAPFSGVRNDGAPNADLYYRWHMHIYPRRTGLPVDTAGAELGFDMNISSVPPETFAPKLRKWFQENPSEDLVVPELVEDFKKTVKNDQK
jgi:galactose-1-phosphate uridylyltransferase